MKTTRIIAVAALIVASGLALHVAQAQQPGIKRTDLQRHDLSVPGREAVQVIVEIAPGGDIPKAHASGRRDHLCPRRLAGVSARGQAAGDAQGRRRLVHPGRNDPRGEKRRQRQRSGARHVHRRKREAAPHAGQVSPLAGQTVVVIGGSSGIGLETARRARAEGADVILTARDPDRLRRIGLELGASTAAFGAPTSNGSGGSSDELPAPIDHVLVTGPVPAARCWRSSMSKRRAATSTPISCCGLRSLGTPRARSAREGPCSSWAGPVAAARRRDSRSSRRSRPWLPP